MKDLTNFRDGYADCPPKTPVGAEYTPKDPFYDVKGDLANDFERRVNDMRWMVSDYFAGEYTETTDDEFADV